MEPLRQQEIDFHRSTQLGILRDCKLPRLAIGRGHGISPMALKAMLTAIDQFARYDRECSAAVATLARAANMGERTASRALAHLEALGVICRERERRQPRGQATVSYTIVWSELTLLCPDRTRRRGTSSAATACHSGDPQGRSTECAATAPRPIGSPAAASSGGHAPRDQLPPGPDLLPPVRDQLPPSPDQLPPWQTKRLLNVQETFMKRRLDVSADAADAADVVTADVPADGARCFSAEEVAEIRRLANQLSACAPARRIEDRELLLKLATLWRDGQLPEDCVQQALEAFQRKREAGEQLNRPLGFLWRVMQNQLARCGLKLERLLATTDFPRELLRPPLLRAPGKEMAR